MRLHKWKEFLLVAYLEVDSELCIKYYNQRLWIKQKKNEHFSEVENFGRNHNKKLLDTP